MAAATPGIDTTTAHRLNIDVGHWRDLLAAHRTGGCTAVRRDLPTRAPVPSGGESGER